MMKHWKWPLVLMSLLALWSCARQQQKPLSFTYPPAKIFYYESVELAPWVAAPPSYAAPARTIAPPPASTLSPERCPSQQAAVQQQIELWQRYYQMKEQNATPEALASVLQAIEDNARCLR